MVFAGIRGGAKTGDAADRAGAGSERAKDTRLLRHGHVLRPDSGGEGNQASDRSERHLRHSEQGEGRDDTGAGALGSAERTAGRRGRLAVCLRWQTSI